MLVDSFKHWKSFRPGLLLGVQHRLEKSAPLIAECVIALFHKDGQGKPEQLAPHWACHVCQLLHPTTIQATAKLPRLPAPLARDGYLVSLTRAPQNDEIPCHAESQERHLDSLRLFLAILPRARVTF